MYCLAGFMGECLEKYMIERPTEKPASIFRIAEICIGRLMLFDNKGHQAAFVSEWGKNEQTGELMFFVQEHQGSDSVGADGQVDFVFNQWYPLSELRKTYSFKPFRELP